MVRRRARNPFPGVHTGPDRHGKLRHRLKRTANGQKIDCYLPGPYGSPEFRAAYEEACEGVRLAGRRAKPGTVAYLIEAYLGSKGYLRLADSTRRDVRGRLDWIKTAIGDAKYSRIEPRHVVALMEKKGGPGGLKSPAKRPIPALPLRREDVRFQGAEPGPAGRPRTERNEADSEPGKTRILTPIGLRTHAARRRALRSKSCSLPARRARTPPPSPAATSVAAGLRIAGEKPRSWSTCPCYPNWRRNLSTCRRTK